MPWQTQPGICPVQQAAHAGARLPTHLPGIGPAGDQPQSVPDSGAFEPSLAMLITCHAAGSECCAAGAVQLLCVGCPVGR